MSYDRERVAAMVADNLESGEEADDVLAGVEFLARERARRFGRPLTDEDVDYFLKMFCWNPLKPDPPETVQAALVRSRRRAFRGAGRDSAVRDRLLGVVRDDAFTWRSQQLYEAQRRSVQDFLEADELPS